jgi:hypothetical protein
MSDYLGNLAAKSLALAPALQPRLASRFEPLAPASPELREGPAFLEETVTEVAAQPPTPIPMYIESHFPSPFGRGGMEVSPRRAERSEEQHADKASVEKVSETSPVPVTKPEPARRRVPAPVEAEPERVQSVIAKRSVQPSETSPPGPLFRGERRNLAEAVVVNRDRLQSLTVIPAPPRQDAPVTPLLSSRERGTGGEASQAERPEHHRPQESLSTIPQLQPRVTLAERQPFAPQWESPAPEPVIHVTIGRIEVRATAAPIAPARERPAARPAVDLGEYLRQRSKGEGR